MAKSVEYAYVIDDGGEIDLFKRVDGDKCYIWYPRIREWYDGGDNGDFKGYLWDAFSPYVRGSKITAEHAMRIQKALNDLADKGINIAKEADLNGVL